VTEYLCGLWSSDHIEYILIYLAENTWNRGYFTRVQVVQVLGSAAMDCFSSSTWVVKAKIRARFFCPRDFLEELTVLPSPWPFEILQSWALVNFSEVLLDR